MNIHTGITNEADPRNPFADWSFIVITYATGDFHTGTGDFRYTGEDGAEKTLHFHGYINFRLGLKAGTAYVPAPRKLLIAGDSAGSFAVPALASEIAKDFFPSCRDLSLIHI